MTARPAPGTPRRALVLLAVLTVLWGTNWPLMPLAVREISVWTFRAVAVLLCGAVLLAAAAARGDSLRIARHLWGRLAICSMANLAIWNVATTMAAILIPSGQAAVLGFTMPLWAALISALFLGERLAPRMLVALALGASSVGLLMLPNFGAYAGAPLGLALGLLAGLCWAVGTLIVKRTVWNAPTLAVTGWQMLLAGVPIAAGAALLGDWQWFAPSWPTVLVVGYIALVPMAVGTACWFAIVGLLPANVAGLSSVLVPVVAVVSGAALHGEPLGSLQIVALLCSVGALSLALLLPARRGAA